MISCTSLEGLSTDVSPASDGGQEDVAVPLGPSCGAGLSCAPVPPPNSKYYLLAPAADAPACPLGYDASGVLYETVTFSPTECTCTCGAVTGTSTCQVSFAVRQGTDATCSGTTGTQSGGTSCYVASFSGSTTHLRVTTPIAAGGGCSSSSGNQNRPPPTTKGYRVCKTQMDPLQGSCTQENLCVRDFPAPNRLCVRADPVDGGSPTCPAAFPTLVTGGTSIRDTRGCAGTCSCKYVPAGPCTNARLDLWRTGGCGGSPDAVIQGNDTCQATSLMNYGSYRFTATAPPLGRCAPAQPLTPTGDVTLSGEVAYCCR